MEENQQIEQKESEIQARTQKSNPMVIVGIILLVAVVGFGIFIAKKKTASPTQTLSQNETVTTQPESSVVAISVEGGSFYFKPNEIRVKKDQKVKIVLSSIDTTHNFVIDEFNIATETISGSQTTEVEFTPDKTGTFEFYCSIGNHRVMGMKGKLIVE